MTSRGEARGIARLPLARTLLRTACLPERIRARDRHDAWLVMLTDGAEVLVRTARADDAGPLQAMHSRCSPESRYLRYFGTASEIPATLLPVLLGLSPGTVALVAEAQDRQLVGLANLALNDDATGEVALLVEDSWQRRGLGTALVRRLVTVARDRRLRALTAVTLPSNGRPARVLRRAGLPADTRLADDVLELRAQLPNATSNATSPDSGCACHHGGSFERWTRNSRKEEEISRKHASPHRFDTVERRSDPR